VDGKAVFDHGSDFFITDIGEFHVETIPFQLLIEALEPDSQHSHDHHFVERTCLAEVGSSFHAGFGTLFAGTDPIQLMPSGGSFFDTAAEFGSLGNTAREEPRVDPIASANQLVFGAVEDHAASCVVHVATGRPSFGFHRLETPVIPGNFHFLEGSVLFHSFPRSFGNACREDEFDHLGVRRAVVEEQGGTALGFGGITQFQTNENGMEDMAGHIAEGAGAEIPPSAPVPRRVEGVVRTHGSWPDKEIPVKGVRDPLPGFRTVKALRPYWTVGESFHFGDFADLAVGQPFTNQVNPLTRRTLVPHLGGHLVFFGQFGQQPRLIHRMGQWFLNINVLAHGHGVRGSDGMGVVGCGDHYCVDRLAHLIVHLAPVLVPFGPGILFENAVLLAVSVVHIAKGHDVLGFQVLEVGIPHPSDTDSGDIQLVARRHMPQTGNHIAGKNREPGCRGSGGP